MTDVPVAAPPVVGSTVIGRITAFVLRHRRWVIAFWVVLLVAGAAGAGQVSKRLKVDFSLPGQPGYEAGQKITQLYGNGGGQEPSIEVVTVPAGTTVRQEQARITAAFDQARRQAPGLRIVDFGSTHDSRFLTNSGRSTYALVFGPVPHSFNAHLPSKQVTPILQHSLPQGTVVQSTGLDELATGSNTKGPGVLLETLVGGAGALIVLAFVFGSLLALLPLLMAAVAILSTLLVVLAITYLTPISFVVEFLVALVGLGVAIDYALLVVTRWREERAHGRDNHAAVRIAMETAGRAVVFSGLTVGIGLVALVVLPVPGLRSIGIGGMLIPLVSVLVCLTLLPAVLGGVGPRMDWPRVRHEDKASRPWTAWARMIVRRRWASAGAALVVLGVLIAPVFGLRIGLTGPEALAKSGPAHAAYEQLLAEGAPDGILTPVEVLTRSSDADAVRSRVAAVPGITTAAISDAPDSNHKGTTVVVAIPHQANLNATASGVVTRVRDALGSTAGVIGVSGIGAIQLDYTHAVFGHFPLMLAVIAVLTFLLLARAFRSILLPAKAVVFNLVSLAAAFGLVTWFWQRGHGSEAVFSIPATGAITFWVPLMIFAFLFGLSMDYEVFILARMREEYDATKSTSDAVITGIGRTGRLVTSAALILFLAFASLASGPETDIKVFATALGAGILLDATIVRALLLPALISVFGRWNWWLPTGFAKVLRVPASALEAPQRVREPEPVGS